MPRLPICLLLLALPVLSGATTDPVEVPTTPRLDLDAMARAKDGPRADQIPDAEPELGEVEAGALVDGESAHDLSTHATVESTVAADPEPPFPADADAEDGNDAAGSPAADDSAAPESLPADSEGRDDDESPPAVEGSDGTAEGAAPAETAGEQACIRIALDLLDAAERGDFAGATANFDDAMQAALSPVEFARAWNSLAQFGALDTRGRPHVSHSSGYIAVNIPLIHERAALYMQVACGEDGRIGGFHVQPLEAMPAQ